MKMRKISQIRPDKSSGIFDLRMTIYELICGQTMADGLRALVAGEDDAADPLRGHSRAPGAGLVCRRDLSGSCAFRLQAKASAFTWLRRDKALKRTHSKRFANGGGGWRDLDVTRISIPQSVCYAGKPGRVRLCEVQEGGIAGNIQRGTSNAQHSRLSSL
ncbi:MAG TPA: hypothetical protein VG347_19330 [Verrucomicrobiae bacterium]|nr:hypothetical protein [Verrucomicrobiae bacterium]